MSLVHPNIITDPIHLGQIRRLNAECIGKVTLHTERRFCVAVGGLQTGEIADADTCLLGQLFLGPSSFPPETGDVEMEDKKVVVVAFVLCHFIID